MALNKYMTLTGETQGQIKGSCTQAGREDTIEIIGCDHEVISPRDEASGLPTGKRQHKPLTVVCAMDKATPLLLQVLTTNENISDLRLDFWRPSRAGEEFQYYTMELTNASISAIRMEGLNNKYPENMKHEDRIHVSFCYQKIIWTWQDGGITAEDDWETPTSR